MTFHMNHNMGRTLEAANRPEEALKLHFYYGDPFGAGPRQEQSESGAVNLYAIGNCYLAIPDTSGTDNFGKGVEYHTRALRIRKEVLGEQGFYYGISLHKTGCILQEDHSMLKEAADTFSKVAVIFRGALDAQRELARSLYRLSVVKQKLSETKAADDLRQEAWAVRQKIAGEGESVAQDCTQDCTQDFDKLVVYIHA